MDFHADQAPEQMAFFHQIIFFFYPPVAVAEYLASPGVARRQFCSQRCGKEERQALAKMKSLPAHR